MNRETLDRTLTISTRTRVLPGVALLTMINEREAGIYLAKVSGKSATFLATLHIPVKEKIPL